MSKNAILLIIALMTAALMGVSIIQVFWIKWSLNLNERNFNSSIFIVLNRVKDKLIEDIKTSPDFIEEYSKNNTRNNDYLLDLEKFLLNTDKEDRIRYEYELGSNLLLLDPSAIIENIDQEKLNRLDENLRSELKNQGISLDYEYGLYSNKTMSFIILNGNFVVEIGNTDQSSTVSENTGLVETPYKVPILDQINQDEPGHLQLYFPKKSGYLWRDLLPIMLSSIIFTALLLFCFSYTVFVIFKQKKISEIKSDFINNMTHEFKTPIATISLASDSIGSPMILGDKEKTKRFLNIIKEENKRMLNQVEKVLQMAQIDKREIDIKPSKIDINQLVERAVNHAELKVQARNGTITMKLNARHPEIEADQTHVSNMIANLLDNAEKYTTAYPMIVVETMDDKDGVKFSVSDNGIGMSKDSIKHIFDKFFRVHTGNLHDVKGFGLGLSYVKAMTEAHGGKVIVQSELNVGSTFTVFLPYRAKKSA